MVVNFSGINQHEKPVLILKRADDTPIGVLGNAKNVEFSPKYNEVSILSFEVPARVDGIDTPFYNEITGQKIIELKDIGQFVIKAPKESGDKVSLKMSVTAESLECEFARKRITLPESTYKFFDSGRPSGTILGMIMELMPNWSVGSVSSSLYNKYRTYDVNNENLYNLIKGNVQQAYNCIFEFDTIRRRVNVRDADATPSQKQVYISRDNLAKDIEVTENTDDIVTRLEVYGADGVDIREVNPTGTNAIINLDYFMNTSNFAQELVSKYAAWKQLVENNKLAFYNYSVQYAATVTEEMVETARLADLKGEYTSLENVQSVVIQGIARGLKKQYHLDRVNEDLRAKKAEITAKEAEIAGIASEREEVMASMTAIRNACAYDRYFTLAEQKAMDPYIVDNAITEPTFVASTVKAYMDGAGNRIQYRTVIAQGSEVAAAQTAGGATFYSLTGGNASIAGIISAYLIRAVVEQRNNGKIILSFYLGNGTYDGASFPSACVSISGTGTATQNTNGITCDIRDAYLFFSLNASDYERKAVAWDLYEYGETLLTKMAEPSYTFSVDSANFIALEDFRHFKNELELGQRVYVEVRDGYILKPICIGATIRWDDRPYLQLLFNDTFTASDGQAKLVEILDQSISMGKTLSAGKFNYEAFTESGASSELHQFIVSALDTAKNAIMSSSEQAISWDGAGLRLRRYADEGHTSYENEQIWMSNNSIVMTDDGWTTAKMAIGKFHDDNLGDKWGIIAPMIVGTLLAGEELVIESQKKSGGTAVFRMDADGCRLYNTDFAITKTSAGGVTTQILLNPDIGLAIGQYPLTNQQGELDTTKATFYVNPTGDITASNLHLTGGSVTMHGFTLTANEMSATADFSIKSGGTLHVSADKLYFSTNDTAESKFNAFDDAIDAAQEDATDALGILDDITNTGTKAVKYLKSTGIEINGNDLTVGAAGVLTIVNSVNGQTVTNAIIMNKDGMTIKSNRTLTIESGGKLYIGGTDLCIGTSSNNTNINTALSNAAANGNAAKTTVDQIVAGTQAVKYLKSTGIEINENDLTVGAAGTLTIVNSDSGQSIVNAIQMNKNGMTIYSGRNLTVESGGFIYIKNTTGNTTTNAIEMNKDGLTIYSGRSLVIKNTTGSQTTNAIEMTKDGMTIKSNRSLNIESGGKLYIGGTDLCIGTSSNNTNINTALSNAAANGNSAKTIVDQIVAGTKAVKYLKSTGIEINENDLIVGAAGTLTIVNSDSGQSIVNAIQMNNTGMTVYSGSGLTVNSGGYIYIKNTTGNTTTNAIEMTKDGIKIKANRSLTIESGGKLYVTGDDLYFGNSTSGEKVSDKIAAAKTAADTANNAISAGVPKVSSSGISISNGTMTIGATNTLYLVTTVSGSNVNAITMGSGGLSIESNGKLEVKSGGKIYVAASDLYFGTPSNNETVSSKINAAKTAADTANNTITAGVPKVSATGISIDVNAMVIGSTASLTIVNGTSPQGATLNAVVMNNQGIAIKSNGSISIESGGTFTVSTGQFSIDGNGNATFSGTLSAPDGNIGGWTTSANSLHTGAGAGYIGIGWNGLYSGIWMGTESSPWYAPLGMFIYNNTDAYFQTPRLAWVHYWTDSQGATQWERKEISLATLAEKYPL